MKRCEFKLTLLGIVLFFITSCGKAQSKCNCEEIVGTWENELGSTVMINSYDAKTGRIEGEYISPSGTSGNSYPLVGWTNRAKTNSGKSNVIVISFTVYWGGIGSITSWTGTCEDLNTVPTIKTIWNLARPSTNYDWEHILTGSDTFDPK